MSQVKQEKLGDPPNTRSIVSDDTDDRVNADINDNSKSVENDNVDDNVMIM